MIRMVSRHAYTWGDDHDKARKTKTARNPAESREEAWNTAFLPGLRQNHMLQTLYIEPPEL